MLVSCINERMHACMHSSAYRFARRGRWVCVCVSQAPANLIRCITEWRACP